MSQKDRARVALARLQTDFEFYAATCVKIRTKNGEQKPLILNPVQKRLLAVIDAQYKATKSIKIVALKARQQGASTMISAYLYWKLSQSRSKKGLIVAHKADSTRALFDMYQRIHTSMPPYPFLKPPTRYSGRRELVFDELDTGIVVATAGGDGIARGETLTHVHLSEVAFYPSATAAENLNALLQAVPNAAPDTAIFIESTANGMSGPFYDLWQGAVNNTNGFIPFFSAWFESPEYRETPNPGFERWIEEDDLATRYGLDDAQLQFRRTKVAVSGRDAFEVEYPSNPDEAFKSSGRPVFPVNITHEMLAKAPANPLHRMAVSPIDGGLEENDRGELLVYHDLDPAEVYTIGADVALGSTKDGDYSVAQILDSQRRQVAMWRSHHDPKYFATILNTLGRHYNNARVAVETNSFGLLTAVSLRDLHYPNIYTEVKEGELDDVDSIKIGFRTTAPSKRLIIGRLISSLKEVDDSKIEINDPTTLKEMLSYVVNEGGGMEAEPGCYDDCVMALAIANHCLEHRWVPIPVPDSAYVNAI